MKMTFTEFGEYLVANVREAGYEMTIRDIQKNNGKVLHGLCLVSENTATPIFYFDQWYDTYLNTTNEDILNEIVDRLTHLIDLHAVDLEIDLSFIRDFERAKHRVFIRLVNAQANMSRLENHPHRVILDMAVEYFLRIDLGEHNMGTISINNSLLDSLKISEEELYDSAIENMRLAGFSFMSMSDILRECCEEALQYEESEMPMYVLSDKGQSFGAAQILVPDICERISEKINGNYYVLPSSIHELIIIPETDSLGVSDLRDMVESVNNECLASEDILSYSVYKYHADKRELLIAS